MYRYSAVRRIAALERLIYGVHDRLADRSLRKFSPNELLVLMYSRSTNVFKSVFKAMVSALLGKVEDPQMMLEETYDQLQVELIETRKELAATRSLELQLSKQLEDAQASGSQSASILEQLAKTRAKMKLLEDKLDSLESEVERAYTKKQVRLARDRAAGHFSNDILVAEAATIDGATCERELSERPRPKGNNGAAIGMACIVFTAALLWFYFSR